MWTRLTVGTLFVLVLAGNVAAQCRVEGVVKGADGAPVAGLTVVLNDTTRTTTTDGEGRYAFDDVKAGTRVRVSALRDGTEFAWEYTLVTQWVERLDLKERPIMTASFAGAVGAVWGTVRARSGRPLPAVSVVVEDPPRHTLTDGNGRYLFTDLPAEKSLVMRARAGARGDAVQETKVGAGDLTDVDFYVAKGPPPSTDAAPAAEASRLADFGSGGTAVIRPAHVAGLPGLVRQNVARAVQMMPGAGAGHEAAWSGLWVRGGTPDQTAVTFDGITLYNTDQLFGLQHVIDAGGLQDAAFRGSNESAADGGRLSGGLRMTGASAGRGSVDGHVDVSMLGVGGAVAVPIGSRVSAVLAVRTSYAGGLFGSALDQLAIGGPSAARGKAVEYSGGLLREATPSRVRDIVGRVDADVTGADAVSVTLLDAASTVDASREARATLSSIEALAEDGVGLPEGTVSRTADIGDWSSRGLSARWARRWSGSTSSEVTVARSTYTDSRDRAYTLVDPTTGIDYAMAVGRGGNAATTASADLADTTIRGDARTAIGFGHAMHLGVEASWLDVRSTAATEILASRNADGTFEAQLTPLVDLASSGQLVSIFAEDAWRPSTRLLLSPGVRLTHDGSTAAWYAEPRLTASYQLSREVAVRGAFGLDHQFLNRVAQEDLLHGDTGFWALADGTTVPVSRSRNVSGGGRIEGAGVIFDLEMYHRWLDDLALFAPRAIPGSQPAGIDEALHIGTGTVSGAEATIRYSAPVNTAWVTYAYNRTEYLFPTLEADAFPAPQDQRHQFKAVDLIRLQSGWIFGATWVYASGRPTTAVESIGLAWLPVGAVVDLPDFATKNSSRLPAYHRLDVSAEREFRVRGLRPSVGVTFLNIYDRSNVSFQEYQGYGQTAVMTDVSLLGRAINLFARIGF